MVFTAADIVQLIINVGLPLATQLINDVQNKVTYTAADFNKLIVTYGTKTAASYLADAQAALGATNPTLLASTTPPL